MPELARDIATGANRDNKACKQTFKVRWRKILEEELQTDMGSIGESNGI